MDKQKFLEEFMEIFEETDSSEITLETRFKGLEEWNSLIVLSLIVHFEENYSVSITAKQINEAEIINDLYKLVK
ncbi:acyl carrier protein [Elizabethkingia anophelis]|jgi:acyl carrier protein|uniref:acyl carrier protein n=1 Tax=Elizabethkingia anophelis TaxID=1117645 RepID=UPI003558F1D4